MRKNLPLEQNIFSFTYFQLDWGVGNNQGGQIFSKSSQIGGGGGNKLKSEEKD